MLRFKNEDSFKMNIFSSITNNTNAIRWETLTLISFLRLELIFS